ncbi:MAG: hypothetical protein JO121_32675 [Deltaproteobacteria bacterium]|nr:hypothetical protein [Deltaproteobacteria bacterium]
MGIDNNRRCAASALALIAEQNPGLAQLLWATILTTKEGTQAHEAEDKGSRRFQVPFVHG